MKHACPDEETLASYLEARLPAERMAMFEKHLSACEQCSQEFEINKNINGLQDMAHLKPAPPGVTDAAAAIISKQMTKPLDLLKQNMGKSAKKIYSKFSEQITLTLMGDRYLVPVRGRPQPALKDTVVFNKAFQGVQTKIEFMRTRADKSDITVRLVRESKNRRGLRLTLEKADREVASEPINADGYVLFEDVPKGRYQLVLHKNGSTMGSYSFTLAVPEGNTT